MPQLISPDASVHVSFVEAMDEFQAEGRGGAADDSMVGGDIRQYGLTWQDPRVFAEYVMMVRADAEEASPRPEGYVPCTTLWYVDGDNYLGRIAIRHTLTSSLLEWGGHIGYDIRPAARRRGHATVMLRTALPIARELGIESALITCDPENIASRRVIEACGGTFEDARHGKLRFWVPTARE